jgi:hypothetical protein
MRKILIVALLLLFAILANTVNLIDTQNALSSEESHLTEFVTQEHIPESVETLTANSALEHQDLGVSHEIESTEVQNYDIEEHL